MKLATSPTVFKPDAVKIVAAMRHPFLLRLFLCVLSKQPVQLVRALLNANLLYPERVAFAKEREARLHPCVAVLDSQYYALHINQLQNLA